MSDDSYEYHSETDEATVYVAADQRWIQTWGDHQPPPFPIVHLPTDPAELHRLVEAILGEPVTIVRHSELPKVTTRPGTETGVRIEDPRPGAPTWALSAIDAEEAWADAKVYLALARHIEARDAAAKEREREMAARIDGWRHFALTELGAPRDVLLSNDLTIVLTALAQAGARAPQGEEAAR